MINVVIEEKTDSSERLNKYVEAMKKLKAEKTENSREEE